MKKDDKVEKIDNEEICRNEKLLTQMFPEEKFITADLYIIEAFMRRETINVSNLRQTLSKSKMLYQSSATRAIKKLLKLGLIKKANNSRYGQTYTRLFEPSKLGLVYIEMSSFDIVDLDTHEINKNED